MGYSQAQKEKTHKRIVAIASKRFREKGLAGFGIAELMKEAGLTVGGFYKHFDSRDELVAEALSDAFGVWQRQKEAAESSGQPLSFAKLIDDYCERCAPQESRLRAAPSAHWRRRSLAAISGLVRLPLNKSGMTLS